MRNKLTEDESTGGGKRGHNVADTLLRTQTFPRLLVRATFVADTNFVSETQKNVSDFCQKHFWAFLIKQLFHSRLLDMRSS